MTNDAQESEPFFNVWRPHGLDGLGEPILVCEGCYSIFNADHTMHIYLRPEDVEKADDYCKRAVARYERKRAKRNAKGRSQAPLSTL